MRCNHCKDAPCVDICPTEALFTREDGIVDFDKDRCIGCKSCMQACPYDALYIDPETSTAAKCNYCAHRVDVGLEPACVNVCCRSGRRSIRVCTWIRNGGFDNDKVFNLDKGFRDWMEQYPTQVAGL